MRLPAVWFLSYFRSGIIAQCKIGVECVLSASTRARLYTFILDFYLYMIYNTIVLRYINIKREIK